jgi:hypothetical protein
VDFGLKSWVDSVDRHVPGDDLVGLVGMSEQDRRDSSLGAESRLRAELRLICFIHQFDMIIVFHFYVRMSDNP